MIYLKIQNLKTNNPKKESEIRNIEIFYTKSLNHVKKLNSRILLKESIRRTLPVIRIKFFLPRTVTLINRS